MYYEMRTYTIQVGCLNEYLKHFEEVGFPIITKYQKCVGFWFTEIGELNQIVHIWEWESLDERAKQRKALYSDPEWLEKFIPKAFPMLLKQESKLMNAANFSPIK